MSIRLAALAALACLPLLTQCSGPATQVATARPPQQAGVDADGFPIAAAAPLAGIQSSTLEPPPGVPAAPAAAPKPATAPAGAAAAAPSQAALPPASAPARTQPFGIWLADLRKEAMAKGVSAQTFDRAFTGVQPIPRVLELDRKQPEFSLTLDEYLAKIVNDQRVQKGRQLLRENRALLDRVAAKYGVPPKYIVALWGIETNYGALTGGFKIVPALATLAYDGRRSSYFRNELLIALQILEKEKIAPDDFTGSWAGAMGQCQFMPSSYQRYAVDFDGNGKRDIWHSRADVFASAANYLSGSGFDAAQGWGREVKLTRPVPPNLIGIETERTYKDWRALGVQSKDGAGLPNTNAQVSLVSPTNAPGRYFLVTTNFKAIMKWNRSTSFAIAAGTLADRIGDG